MISSTIKAVGSIFPIAQALALPWVVWDWVKETVRYVVSLNGYAINPNGVLGEEKDYKDDKGSDSAEEEGENKEEDG